MEKTNVFGKAVITQNNFHFSPRTLIRGYEIEPKSCHGQAILNRDGTFDFIHHPRKNYRGVLIKKLAHGRLSSTKDGGILLTLKFMPDENLNIAEEMHLEAWRACQAIAVK